MASLTGAVERIVFHNSDSGFTVARFHLSEPSGKAQSAVTIVGTLPTIRAGEMLRLLGEWEIHPVHGRNFRVQAFEPELPTAAVGSERYLASGAIRGVGPVTARRIVEVFGVQTMDVIDTRPDMLREVAGISEKRLEVIKEAWAEQKNVRDIMMFLQEHEVSVALAARLYATYGDRAVEIVREDPFRLAHDVHGIGFRTADGLARKLGIAQHSISRYVPGLRHVVSEATDDGHVFLTRPVLLERAEKLLDAQRGLLEPALLELIQRDFAAIDGDRVYLTPFYKAETGTVRLLSEIARTPSSLTLGRPLDLPALIEEAGSTQGLELAEKQKLAVAQALREKVSILTGGPGTGKTSTLRTIISALESLEA